MPGYWLCKSEPDVYSIDDLRRDTVTGWEGVRNYQARNFMRDGMQPGDRVLVYHSNAEPTGVAGIAEVAGAAKADPTQFDRRSKYYDASSKREAPRWLLLDIRARRKTRLIPLSELRSYPQLAGMALLRRGNRLSITPVDPDEWKFILGLMK